MNHKWEQESGQESRSGFSLHLLYLSFMPFGAVSPSAIHDLNAVERSQDKQGSSYSNPHRNQHPRHVSRLHEKETITAILKRQAIQGGPFSTSVRLQCISMLYFTVCSQTQPNTLEKGKGSELFITPPCSYIMLFISSSPNTL